MATGALYSAQILGVKAKMATLSTSEIQVAISSSFDAII